MYISNRFNCWKPSHSRETISNEANPFVKKKSPAYLCRAIFLIQTNFLMELEKTIIKKVYDEYLPKDHSYGTLDSTNLNPKREVQLDKLERIAQKLQQISDDIVRKKLTPKETFLRFSFQHPLTRFSCHTLISY